MQPHNIHRFALDQFKCEGYTTIGYLQRYIKDRPEVAKILPPDDVQQVLDEMVFDGDLYIKKDQYFQYYIIKRRFHGV